LEFRLNQEIRSPQVHLIDQDGQSKGTLTTAEALALAQEAGLDLVEIAPKATPPVAKILDYNKYRYELEKKGRDHKASRGSQLKEVRLSFGISEHDLETKARKAREFLKEGSFVRVFIQLKGRQNIFPDKARQTLSEFAAKVEGVVEQSPTQVGKRISLIVKPGKNSKN